MNRQKGWIGIDLDGTLAFYDGWKGIEHIGEPIPLMLQRVIELLDYRKDIEVKIFTARVVEGEEAIKYIKAWCLKHIGQELEVTNIKDFAMIELYDDRCIQVEHNTGILVRKK